MNSDRLLFIQVARGSGETQQFGRLTEFVVLMQHDKK